MIQSNEVFMPLSYELLDLNHFEHIIDLGNRVHGDNYIDHDTLEDIYKKSWHNSINASWVALDEDQSLLGFRLTLAAENWKLDKWCSPTLWDVDPSGVCYFKCNTVAPEARGQGVGSTLLQKSIMTAKQQGARAGLAHIWLASPNNSAFNYFSRNGGKLIKKHPNKWQIHSLEEGYLCPVCGSLCTCCAAEMLLKFEP